MTSGTMASNGQKLYAGVALFHGLSPESPGCGPVLGLFGANPYPMSPEAYERQANAYVQHDALDRLGGIRAPALVLTGERDRLAPPWIGRELAEAIPGAANEE